MNTKNVRYNNFFLFLFSCKCIGKAKQEKRANKNEKNPQQSKNECRINQQVRRKTKYTTDKLTYNVNLYVEERVESYYTLLNVGFFLRFAKCSFVPTETNGWKIIQLRENNLLWDDLHIYIEMRAQTNYVFLFLLFFSFVIKCVRSNSAQNLTREPLEYFSILLLNVYTCLRVFFSLYVAYYIIIGSKIVLECKVTGCL